MNEPILRVINEGINNKIDKETLQFILKDYVLNDTHIQYVSAT